MVYVDKFGAVKKQVHTQTYLCPKCRRKLLADGSCPWGGFKGGHGRIE